VGFFFVVIDVGAPCMEDEEIGKITDRTLNFLNVYYVIGLYIYGLSFCDFLDFFNVKRFFAELSQLAPGGPPDVSSSYLAPDAGGFFILGTLFITLFGISNFTWKYIDRVNERVAAPNKTGDNRIGVRLWEFRLFERWLALDIILFLLGCILQHIYRHDFFFRLSYAGVIKLFFTFILFLITSIVIPPKR